MKKYLCAIFLVLITSYVFAANCAGHFECQDIASNCLVRTQRFTSWSQYESWVNSNPETYHEIVYASSSYSIIKYIYSCAVNQRQCVDDNGVVCEL